VIDEVSDFYGEDVPAEINRVDTGIYIADRCLLIRQHSIEGAVHKMYLYRPSRLQRHAVAGQVRYRQGLGVVGLKVTGDLKVNRTTLIVAKLR
jgi:hypothetical protein